MSYLQALVIGCALIWATITVIRITNEYIVDCHTIVIKKYCDVVQGNQTKCSETTLETKDCSVDPKGLANER